jgi:hypothetical protein
MIDPIATTEAIRILEEKRIEAAPLPVSVWDILHNAGKRLDRELRDYFRDETATQRDNKAA